MRWAVLLALAATASADGKFLSPRIPVVEIKDQQAIVVWEDGRERLVIDTAHSGEGDLAWIVPLPAPPRIEPVSPAVFRTLEVVTMPDVVAEPSEAWKLALFLLATTALMLVIPPGLWTRVLLVAVVFLGFMAFAILIPKSAGMAKPVTLLARGEAGGYETATLQSVDAGALLSWLDREGFKVAPGLRDGIEAYVRDGWVFAVARLKSGGAGGRAHPLSFEFEAKEPVYPMRLTSMQERGVSLRLFVLSDRRALCDALETLSCYRVDPATDDWPIPFQEGEEREIGQPELMKIAGDAYVLTTLSGRTERGAGDLRIGLEKYAPLAPTLHSRKAAATGALSYALGIAFFLLLPSHLVASALRKQNPEKKWRRTEIGRRGKLAAWGASLGAGLLAGAVYYLTCDVAPMRGDEAEVPNEFELHLLHAKARDYSEAATDLGAAREAARRIWLGRVNPYTGRPVEEEPSPGNYSLALRDGKVDYVTYDARGVPVTDRR